MMCRPAGRQGIVYDKKLIPSTKTGKNSKEKSRTRRGAARTNEVPREDLLSSVQLSGELALLAGCGVLVDDSLGSSLIDGLNSVFISSRGSVTAGDDSSVKLLHHGLQLSFGSTVAGIVDLADQDTLFSRLDVGHDSDLPYSEIYSRDILSFSREKCKPNLHIFFCSTKNKGKSVDQGGFVMELRTDLALERRELRGSGALQGVVERRYARGPLKITEIQVTSALGERALNKPRGRYLTAELPPEETDGDLLYACARGLSRLLQTMLPEHGTVLVAGLGNRAITPDALGPETVSHLIVTRHLLQTMPEIFGGMRPVCALAAGVLGDTGIETAELLRGVVERVQPQTVVAIDALCARSLSRLCRTVQLSDTGIVPGSGACNPRKALNEATLGVPVIGIGVPTVVEAETLAMDLAGRPLKSGPENRMLVSPRDMDRQIVRCGTLLGFGLNLALQGDMPPSEMTAYLS